MVYEGFMSFGGNEIINSERTRGYVESSDCPVNWFVGDRCEGLGEALGDAEYTTDTLPLAPWYDISLPELSGRFFGVHGLSMTGLQSSTRSADTTEGIADGGVIGRTRKGVRAVRIRAILTAMGRDALDYGFAWMSSALDPGACGQHGTECGTTDMAYFSDCPPARAVIEDFTPWTETRRNMIPRPVPIADGDWYETTGVIDPEFTRRPGVPTLRNTTTSSQTTLISGTMLAPGLADLTGAVPVVPGETYTVSAYGSASIPDFRSVIQITWVDSTGSSIGNELGAYETGGVIGEWQRPSATGVAPANAAFLGPVIRVVTASDTAPAGTQAWVTDSLMEVGDTVGEFIAPGVIPDTDTRRVIWVGGANESASVEEIREGFMRPQTDEEYAATLMPYRRFLHDVAATSGPLLVDIFESKTAPGVWGAVVEWTITSERPWIYSATRPVDLPVTPTLVIQDTPFNLVPYPSAELAGADVDAATNYSPNPSVETNDTDWGYATSVTSGSALAPYVTDGRVVGELQAVGDASYRVRLLGDSTVASGRGKTWALQTVPLSSRPAGSRVSISVWGAVLILGGFEVTELIELRASVLWRDASNEILRQDTIETVTDPAELDGHVFSERSIEIPVATDRAFVRLEAVFDWESGPVNSDVRLYADALAVTVP